MRGRVYEATCGRMFAALYDRMLGASERAGLAARRGELLAAASGRTLEIGAGTGLNIERYPGAVTELIVTEPDLHMVKRLRRRVLESDRRIELVAAPGESLPFPDNDFDTVALTLVLCTAPDPEAVLREVARVLKPRGRLLFLEHVRSDEPGLAKWQDRLHGPWKLFGDGCNCNRDTLTTIARHLEVEAVERSELPKAPPIVKPLIAGSARPARG